MSNQAMFIGLVFDEDGNPADLKYVGSQPCYVLDDDGFLRHIDAQNVDRQVIRYMREQVDGNRDMAVSAMLEMMGKDDIFTKAAVETSINNMEDVVGQPIPDQAKQWLGMLGFKITIDYEGTVVDVAMPAGAIDEDGDWE
ncbi:MAG: hypothetical protein AAF702_34925 [Chloroflexota bacterium]